MTRSARITGRSGGSTLVTAIEADGKGNWQVDGVPTPHLPGCLDLDLEASAMTTTFPVHRLCLHTSGRSSRGRPHRPPRRTLSRDPPTPRPTRTPRGLPPPPPHLSG
ncbi:MAG TPA: putative glycolipid-binding domain-containing protein [Actinokineospora sp.]|nr:putative glycolipid-binding domain-containing protein [Actinokineospora sp.]